jgi:hypothetical protein
VERRLTHPRVPPIVAAAIALIAALYYYRPWVFHLDVPFDASGDALQKLQLVLAASRHGWFLENPSIGLPGVGEHVDFPRYDSLNYIAIKLWAWLLPTPIAAANVYYLLGFPVTAATAAWVLSRFDVSSAWAVVGGVAYAWLPYHPLQGFGHFTNAFYGFVPLGTWLAWDIWQPSAGPRSRRWWAAAVAIPALVQAQNNYYGFFLALIVVTIGGVVVARRRLVGCRDGILASGVVLGVLLLAFAAEQLPRWALEFREGKNLLGFVRTTEGPTTYALSIINLLSPSPNHPLSAFRDFARDAAVAQGHVGNERLFVSLPFVGILGVAVIIAGCMPRSPGGRPVWASRARDAGLLCFIVLLWAHEGAISTLMARAGFSVVRSWNRMAVYLAFATVVAAFCWLDARTRAMNSRKRYIAVASTLSLVLLEQLATRPHVPFGEQVARLDEWKVVTDAVSDSHGPRSDTVSRAFVLPYLDYPEIGTVDGVADYDHFGFLLASERLSLSYGSMRGRGAYYYGSATSGLEGSALLDLLEGGGFDSVIVDRASTEGRRKLGELRRLLGRPIVETARYTALRMSALGSQRHQNYREYQVGTRLDFAGEPAARRFLQLNFSGYEPGGTWTLGNRATLRLWLAMAAPVGALEIEGQLLESPERNQRVQVVIDERLVCTLDRLSAAPGTPNRWTCPLNAMLLPPGEHEIAFHVQTPIRPNPTGGKQDLRPLGLRLAALTVAAPRGGP